jgi:hypothetical protein
MDMDLCVDCDYEGTRFFKESGHFYCEKHFSLALKAALAQGVADGSILITGYNEAGEALYCRAKEPAK